MFIREMSNLWPLKRESHVPSEANLCAMLAQVNIHDNFRCF